MKTEMVRAKCEICGFEKVFPMGTHVGGHPIQGWMEVKIQGGSTMLADLQKKLRWDICNNPECIQRFAKGDYGDEN